MQFADAQNGTVVDDSIEGDNLEDIEYGSLGDENIYKLNFSTHAGDVENNIYALSNNEGGSIDNINNIDNTGFTTENPHLLIVSSVGLRPPFPGTGGALFY